MLRGVRFAGCAGRIRPNAAVVLAAAIALFCGFPPSPAVAQTAQKTYCSEPVEPFCTKSDATFEDKATTESCQEDVTEFVAEMKQFAVCLGKQQSEARERAKAVQDRFACMAANRDDCGTR